MKKHILTIILAVTCVGLVIAFQLQRQENIKMRQRAVSEEIASPEASTDQKAPYANAQSTAIEKAVRSEKIQPEEVASRPESESAKQSNRRIMRDMAEMIEENPTINKMVEASQRGALGALYVDMIEFLDLNADETRYFMDLLMYRQMANIDVYMKMASGNLPEDEKKVLQQQLKRINETMRSEMELFLNDNDDYDEFIYYEDTIGERMVLSQMDQKLGDASLTDEAYRSVLDIMYQERKNYNWSTDLNDSENRDLSPERFSQDNIRKHMADVKALGELMDTRMQEILTPEQLAAWRESGAAMQRLIESQLLQANRMYGAE